MKKIKKVLPWVAIATTVVTISPLISLASCSKDNKPVVPTTMSINGPDSVKIGKTSQYSITVNPSDASTLCNWKVKTGVEFATIDQSGVLHANEEGTVVIEATSQVGNVSASKTITIVKEPEPEVKGLFEINQGVLKGFNTKLTPAELNQRLESMVILTIPEGVESIADNAFYNESRNESILPPNILAINLYNDKQLKSIGDSAFRGSKILSIYVPGTVTHLGDYAFAECSLLSEIDISEFTETPEGWSVDAWDDISNYGVVRLLDKYAEIAWRPYFEQVEMPATWEALPQIDIEILNINDEGKLIGFNPQFSQLSPQDQQEVYPKDAQGHFLPLIIPSQVTSIANYAFYNQQSNASIVPTWIPALQFAPNSRCKSIGEYAFCEAEFKTVSIPASVETIGEKAFGVEDESSYPKGEGTITTLNLPDIKTIPSRWTIGQDWTNWGMLNAEGVITYRTPYQRTIWNQFFAHNIEIEETSTTGKWYGIAQYKDPFAISNGKLLGFKDDTRFGIDGYSKDEIESMLSDSLVIPRTVTSIDAKAFIDSSDNTTIPEKVKSLKFEDQSLCSAIGERAFFNSTIESITIPKTIVTLDNECFGTMNSLKNIHVKEFQYEDLQQIINVEGKWHKNAFKYSGPSSVEQGPTMIEIHNFGVINLIESYYIQALKYAPNFSEYAPEYHEIFDYTTEGNNVILNGFSSTFNGYDIHQKEAVLGNALIIPASVTKIADGAFINDEFNSTIPNFVEKLVFFSDTQCLTIGKYAFFNASFTNISIPKSVTGLGAYCFAKSEGSTASINTIDLSQHRQAPTLEEGVFDNNIATSGLVTCYYKIAPQLQQLALIYPDLASWNVKTVGDIFKVENGVLTGFNDQFKTSTYEEKINQIGGDTLFIPYDVTSIADNAFVEKVGEDEKSTIPDFVDELKFEGKKCTSIGAKAFLGSNMSTITIPKSVTTIGASAFGGLGEGDITTNRLQEIHLPGITEATIPEGWVHNTPGTEIFSHVRTDFIETPFKPGVAKIYVGNKDITQEELNKLFSHYDADAETETNGTVWNGGHITNAWQNQYEETIFELFNIENGVLNGFSDDFFNLTHEQQNEKLQGHLIIPAGISSIADNAFSNEDPNNKKLPTDLNISYLEFEEGSACAKIGDKGFYNHTFKYIELPNSLNKANALGKKSFYSNMGESEVSPIESIDLTDFTSGLEWTAPSDLADAPFGNLNPTIDYYGLILTSNNNITTGKFESFANVKLSEETIGNIDWNNNSWLMFNTTDLQSYAYDIDESGVLNGFTADFAALPSNVQKKIMGTTMIIPSVVTEIAANAFSENLKTTLPNFIKEIKFAKGSQCKKIGSSAFAGMTQIEKVVLPAGIETIGASAFSSLYKLGTAYQNFSNLKVIDLSAYDSIPDGWVKDNIVTVRIFAYLNPNISGAKIIVGKNANLDNIKTQLISIISRYKNGATNNCSAFTNLTGTDGWIVEKAQ